MKAFLLSLAVGGLLAWGASFVLDNWFERSADQTYVTPNARVGQGGSVAARNFSGG